MNCDQAFIWVHGPTIARVVIIIIVVVWGFVVVVVLTVFYFIHLVSYNGGGQTLKEWQMSGIGVHGMKSIKHYVKNVLKIILCQNNHIKVSRKSKFI